MPVQNVQLSESDLQDIEAICKFLGYRNQSEYVCAAIREKIRGDRRRFRELKRQDAAEAYGSDVDIAFLELEGEAFGVDST